MTTIQYSQVQVADGVIDLGVGQPDASVFPVSAFERAAGQLFSQGDGFLQYGAEYGDGWHRVALADFLSDSYGVPIDPELLFSTNGNSQALDMVCTVFTRPGDVVITEEPTYFLARGIFADHGLETVGVPLDEEGIEIDRLETILAQLADSGRPARFIYSIPAHHNPTSINLSASRRSVLPQVAAQYGAMVVADEVYQLLGYGTGDVPAMSALVAEGNVISLGTFSKILAPGLRLGWIHSSSETLHGLAGSGLIASGGGLNPFTSALVTDIMRSGDLASNISKLRSEYTRRIEVMDEALHAQLPEDVSWRRPTGGYFFWLHLPNDLDGTRLRAEANRFGLDLRPGTLFSTEGEMNQYIRLSFAFYLDSEIREGVGRLGRAIRSYG